MLHILVYRAKLPRLLKISTAWEEGRLFWKVSRISIFLRILKSCQELDRRDPERKPVSKLSKELMHAREARQDKEAPQPLEGVNFPNPAPCHSQEEMSASD